MEKKANKTEAEGDLGDLFFVGCVKKTWLGRMSVKVFLELEGKSHSVGTVTLSGLDVFGSSADLVDKALQKWVIDGIFWNTINNPKILPVLKTAQHERQKGVEWYRRTRRFILSGVKENAERKIRFVFTDDKSDIPDYYRRILQIGEKAVAEEDRIKKCLEKEDADRKENLRNVYANNIRVIAEAAINGQPTLISVQEISELGLLEPSTTFRSAVCFPGEKYVLRYDFKDDDGIRYMGFIGFDVDLKFLSVDERLPKPKERLIN